MTFRKRVVLGYGISLGLVLVICALSVFGLSRVRRTGDALVEDNYYSTLACDRMVYSLERQNRAILRLLLDSSQEVVAAFGKNAMEFESRLKVAREHVTLEQELELLDTIAENYGRYVDVFEQVYRLHREGSLTAATATYDTSLKPVSDELLATIETLAALNHQEVAEASQEIKLVSRAAELGVVFAALLLAGVGWLVLSRLANQIDHLENRRQRMVEMDREAKLAAEQASQAKTRFLATVTHELRTPLTGILGTLEVLDRDPADLEQHLDVIRSSARALLSLVNDLLDISRIESGRLEIHDSPFDPAGVATDTVNQFRPSTSGRDVELELELSDELPRAVLGDADRLRQILTNLVGNSLKFTSRGTVKLAVSVVAANHERAELVFRVSDTGMGIPQDKLKVVFEPFQQLENNDGRRFGGAGLGLSIVKALVEKMGGTIDLESKLGEGTTFTVWLPFPLTEAVEAAEQAPGDQTVEGVSVLLVEDNPINRRVVSMQLQQLGASVDAAAGGREALERLAQQAYGVVLMDCQMPDMDGYETVRRIRASGDERVRSTVVVALTAQALKEEADRCLEAGMNDYLSKPVDSQTLLGCIQKWTRAQR